MAAVFLKLLNLSISASWLVLAVLVLRLISKRSPKWMIGASALSVDGCATPEHAYGGLTTATLTLAL